MVIHYHICAYLYWVMPKMPPTFAEMISAIKPSNGIARFWRQVVFLWHTQEHCEDVEPMLEATKAGVILREIELGQHVFLI